MPHPDTTRAASATSSAGGPTSLNRRAAIARLAGLVGVLVGFGAVFFAGGVIGTDRVRDWIDPLGPWGPLLYIPLAAVLGTLFVPGAVLAAAAGLLFGPWVGALAALAAGTCGALLSRAISARAGQRSFDAVADGKVLALARFAREHGVFAVIVARLAPWLPDAPVNHAFGIVGLRATTVATGHVIAAGPRALAYAMVGANTGEPTGTSSLLGWGLNIATCVAGTVLLVYVVRRHRRAARADAERPSDDGPPEATQE